MFDDDDATVFQTEEDKDKLKKEILSGKYDLEDDTEDDTTIRDF